MTTGDRMKLRRKELGMSAESIAEKIGVSAATVYRYEKGDIEKVPGDILVPLAQALHTTPSYLMGWMDADEAINLSTDELQERMKKEKTEFMELFRKHNAPTLNEDGSTIMRVLMEFFLFKLEQGAKISEDIKYMNEYLQKYIDES